MSIAIVCLQSFKYFNTMIIMILSCKSDLIKLTQTVFVFEILLQYLIYFYDSVFRARIGLFLQLSTFDGMFVSRYVETFSR